MNKFITEFSTELKIRNLAPKNIQFSNWHEWTIVTSFDEDDTHFISESATTGIDKDPLVALMKSLTEFCERNVFKTSDEEASKATERSDGFAAYPSSMAESKIIVRKNAFNEAVERYLWATWWDNSSILFDIEEILSEDFNKIKNEFNVVKLSVITVKAVNSTVELKILLAETIFGGFVTGGAAGDRNEIDKTYSRAFGELLRHLFVVKRMAQASIIENMSFYEQRLWGFGSGQWGHLVKERLCKVGYTNIVLPVLVIDQEINHGNSDFVYVYRCLFKNQPLFIGGNLERLCI